MSHRCEVQSGPGLVARGSGVVWVGPDCDRGLAETLISCAQLTGPGSAGVLSAVAAFAPDRAGSFAVAVPNGAGWSALWRGEGRVYDGDREIDGRPATGGWIAASFVGNGHIAVGRPPARGGAGSGSSADLAELTDLSAGVVPGAGALLISDSPTGAERVSPPSTPRPAAVPSRAPESQPRSMPQPIAEPEPAPRGATGFTGAAQEPTQTWTPPAPAQLLFDDGHNLDIDRDLVLGRRPEQHDLVVNGGARPIAIDDNQNVLSSAHAAVQLRGDEVYLLDLGSLNGTHIASASATEWTRLDSGVARRLEEGDRLLLGWTIITFVNGPHS